MVSKFIRVFLLVVLLVLLLWLIGRGVAAAHYKPGPHNVWHASMKTWCGHSNRVCQTGLRAHLMAGCETGGTYDKWASNGQYLGLWQMGSHERHVCGETWGRDPWAQARSARCWLRLAGWDAWPNCS